MENKEPLITIITAAYNGEKYIRRLLDSVLQQSYCHIEHIVVDDGSSDSTPSIIKEYQKKYSDKHSGLSLVFISETNGGVAKATETALRAMTGDYFFWEDQDDWLLPDFVSRMAKEAEHHPKCGLVRGNGMSVVEGNPDAAPIYWSQLPNGHIDVHPDVFYEMLKLAAGEKNTFFYGKTMVRSSDLRKVLPSLSLNHAHYGQEPQILLPMYLSFDCCFMSDPLAVYLRRPDSTTVQGNATTLEKYEFMSLDISNNFVKVLEPLQFENKKKWIKKIQRKWYRELFFRFLLCGNFAQAKKYLVLSSKASPIHEKIIYRILYVLCHFLVFRQYLAKKRAISF